MSADFYRTYADLWDELVDRFVKIPVLMQQSAWEGIVTQMSRRGFPVQSGNPSRAVSIELLNSALSERNGLYELCRIVGRYDVTDYCKAFVKLAKKSLPTGYFETVEERWEFIEFVDESSTDADLKRFYAEALDDPPERDISHAAELIEELEELSAQDDCHPLIRLTEAIAHRADKSATAHRAHRWSDDLASRIDRAEGTQYGPSELDKLEALRQERAGAPPTARAAPVLTLMFEPKGNAPNNYLLSATLYHRRHQDGEKLLDDETPVTLQEAEDVVIRTLRRAAQILFADKSAHEKPVLEFVLPRKLLSFPVEDWRIAADSGSTLNFHFIVVVREFERHTDDGRMFSWRQKWHHMMTADRTGGCQLAHWMTCSSLPHLEDLDRQLSPEECDSLGLTYEPRANPNSFEVSAELKGALDAGTPVAIWPRWPTQHGNGATDCADGTCLGIRFKDDLSRQLLNGKMTDLPQLVLRIRRDPSEPRGLTLLWDDPRRVVRPTDYRLDAPGDLSEEK